MLTDRISLELARSYLMGVKSTYSGCTISNISFRYANTFSEVKTTSVFVDDIGLMLYRMDQVAPKMTLLEAECPTSPMSTMGLYELRSFTIKFSEGNTAIVQNKGNIGQAAWNTSSSDVFRLTIDDLNEYQRKYSEVEMLYLHVYDKEYIQKQLTYVECKYIQTLFGPIIDQINEKYQNPQWHLKG
jgi:hypothetical protein